MEDTTDLLSASLSEGGSLSEESVEDTMDLLSGSLSGDEISSCGAPCQKSVGDTLDAFCGIFSRGELLSCKIFSGNDPASLFVLEISVELYDNGT